MPTPLLTRLLVAGFLICAGSVHAASSGAGGGAKSLYDDVKRPSLVLGGGYHFFDTGSDLGDSAIPGGGFSYRFNKTWGAEFIYSSGDADRDNGSDVDFDKWHLDANYFWPAWTERWQIFAVAGAGMQEFDDDDEATLNAGIGLRWSASRRVAVDGVGRFYMGLDEDETEGALELSLHVILGSLDKKPKYKEPVDGDDDNDGVKNSVDACPSTQAGERVDASGCAIDSDGDGVTDGNDACPRTPPGAPVDARGCPLDTDGDGVYDYADACPGTPRGTPVDDRGCPLPTEPVTFSLNVEFATDRDAIRSVDMSSLREFGDFMRKYPAAVAVIEGHTDSTGNADYNQQLSERRARQVMQYLIANERIGASRLSAVGYGEARPIADNETAEGRQRNRRVSAVVNVGN